ncbi:Glutamate synthase [NADPH] small chain [Labilithrix luteola]|uniref:Glutamate synthase [NADPH] small chain n=1 Tax=Labilithrix luteola TaxID=1391654 RepID=A0A0K1PWA2_9BACT|nr:glutamate synthase subunit beta [Labilithrix luteola]AKU97671.1 Glutamate synthase [NADPH] small chain [Labilithrix luteola]
MADPRGFIKVKRKKPSERPVDERVNDYAEFVHEPSPEELTAQASRCMDCGIPFCHQGCPLGNLVPEFNDLVWRGRMTDAARVLHSTNNFPEFTGRVCPAPCEASCVLNIDNAPVTIKDVERTIANAIGSEGLVPVVAKVRTGKKVAVVGSGPAGLAAAQELARAGHDVTVFERDDRIGGLLRYGIPDFKLEKAVIDARLEQMRAEGVVFRTSVDVRAEELRPAFDAVVLATGARVPRDLPVAGRELEGIHFAMDYLVQQNKRVAGDMLDSARDILATGKHVVVIGGGDTGSDCVGTSNRQGAASVVQLELMPKPPLVRMPENPWPAWPLVYRTSSSHEEGCGREFSVVTKGFAADASGKRVAKLLGVRAQLTGGSIRELPGSEFEIPCDIAFLAMGFTGPERAGLVEELGLALDARGNVVSDKSGATSVPGIFAAGDASRGQSLVVWAIADGRRVAAGVSAFLTSRKLRVLPGGVGAHSAP